VTKEGDWDVARVYVALADNPHSSIPPDDSGEVYEDVKEKEKMERENGGASGSSTLEERAVDRYMDDDEWEARERRGGRGVLIPRFPLAASESGSKTEKGKWSVPVWMRWSSTN